MEEEIKDKYLSIATASEGLYKEKGSKFIALAFPVEEEEQIRQLLEETKKKYHDARHHCYAWRLGADGEPYRYNDDGEPGGTAGKPIHGQLLSKELSDILLIVIRYFGGTKLGTSGLINAYKQSSRDALDNASVIEKTITARFELHFEYPKMNDVMRFLREEHMEIERTDFQISCKLVASIPYGMKEQLSSKLDTFYGVGYTILETKTVSQ